MKILVVSDDQSMTSAAVSVLSSKHVARTEFSAADLDLVESFRDADSRDNISILSVGTDLAGIAATIRNSKIGFALIAATPNPSPSKTVSLLDAGYDDVVPYPSDPEELAARFRAIARRYGNCTGNAIKIGRITFFLDGKDPEIDGKRVKLSNIEFSIIETLARRAGNVVSREVLFERVWPDSDKQPFDKVLDVHIHNIRTKFEKAGGDRRFITTIPSRGFMLTGGV